MRHHAGHALEHRRIDHVRLCSGGVPDEAELAADSEKIEIDGAAGTYVQLIGAQDAILGVVAFSDGMAWFIKLQGDHDLAIAERTRYEEFLKSIRFE